MLTVLATSILALAIMGSPALAYSNVSPKPGVPVPQKMTSIRKSMRSFSSSDEASKPVRCFTRFECIDAPVWTRD